MKLGYTILYVESVAETIAFYEQAFDFSRGMVVSKANGREVRRYEAQT